MHEDSYYPRGDARNLMETEQIKNDSARYNNAINALSEIEKEAEANIEEARKAATRVKEEDKGSVNAAKNKAGFQLGMSKQ